MICEKCKNALPDDSEFCQFCGSRITLANATPKVESAPTALQDTALPGEDVVEKMIAAGTQDSFFNSASEVNRTKDRKPRKKGKALSIVLAIALVFSIVANIAQYFYHSHHAEDFRAQLAAADATIVEKSKTITSQATTIIQQDSDISVQAATIRQQKAELSKLKDKSNYFDEIVREMRYCNTGYAAYNFFASDSVIVVSKNDTNRKFTLTANWPNGGTVEVDYSSDAAWVSFDNNNWRTSTTMTVHPISKGVTVVTFSNTVDYNAFKVLIVVTD